MRSVYLIADPAEPFTLLSYRVFSIISSNLANFLNLFEARLQGIQLVDRILEVCFSIIETAATVRGRPTS